MALGVPAPPMDPAAVARLLEKLRAHWKDVAPNPSFYMAPGGVNNATHLVLRDSSGFTIGLKEAERGIKRGTKKELVASYLARRMILPLAPVTHLITSITGGA